MIMYKFITLPYIQIKRSFHEAYGAVSVIGGGCRGSSALIGVFGETGDVVLVFDNSRPASSSFFSCASSTAGFPTTFLVDRLKKREEALHALPTGRKMMARIWIVGRATASQTLHTKPKRAAAYLSGMHRRTTAQRRHGNAQRMLIAH